MAVQQSETQLRSSSWNEWLMKWHETIFETSQGNATLIQAQCNTQCNNIKECLVFRRILYIMQFYQQFQQTSNNIKTIFECFSNDDTQNYYNLINLYDDHIHIIQFHKNNDNDCQYIFDEISKYYPCNINKCLIIKRNIKQENIKYKLDSFYKQFNGELYEIALIQILDKIHCSLYHSYDLFKMTNKEIELFHNMNLKTNKLNKNDLFNRSYYLQLKDFMKDKYQKLINLKGEKTLQMSKKYSTITISKRFISISQDDEKKLYDSDDNEIKLQKTQKSKLECFGLRYFYDEIKQNKNETLHATFVKKKYKSLQRELTHNILYKIDIFDWNQQMFHAQIYADSQKNRYLQCNLESIIAIIFYCNFETLQSMFKETYILISKKDNYKLAAERHHEFVNWAIILNKTINNFGIGCNDESNLNDKFYHALIEPISINNNEINQSQIISLDFNFNESYMRFYCPLLTSKSIEVLLQYSRNKNGMIISLCPLKYGCMQKYFDCVWLSNFEYEESKIFMNNNKYIMNPSIMRINDMIDTQNYYNFKNYFNGISILNCIINNKIILFETDKYSFDALGKLFQHRLRPISYTMNNNQEAYIDAMFARFCQIQTGIITIDMNKISELCVNNKNANSFLRNYLISKTAINTNVFVLKCHNFVELFNFVPSIEIKNCCLNAIMFELICQSLQLQENKIDLELIEFSNINEELSDLTCDEIVAKYTPKLDEIAWIIKKTEFAEIKLEKLKYILLNPKCKLSVNIFNAAFYYGNAQRKNTDQNGQIQKEIKTSHGIYQVKIEYFNINKNNENNNKKWIVDKRYSDFLRLHKYCIKKRDGIRPIQITKVKFPPKTLFRKPNTTNVMEERRGKFEQYIKYLLIQSYKHTNKIYLKKLSHFLSPQGLKNCNT